MTKKIYRSTVTITLLDEDPFAENCLDYMFSTLDDGSAIFGIDIAYNDKVFDHPSDELTTALLEMGNDGTYFDDEEEESDD